MVRRPIGPRTLPWTLPFYLLINTFHMTLNIILKKDLKPFFAYTWPKMLKFFEIESIKFVLRVM